MAITVDRVPVTVLTGFLGAGKTTLLNRILTEHHGKRIAVIENEFGEIGIDHELVVNADEEIFEMNNGCICCTVRGDLIRILSNLMKRRDRFDYILIETTGMAEPGPVAQTFYVDDEMQDRLRLDGIVTLVDAKHVWQHFESDEVKMQIAFADVILLNKTDLVPAAELDRLEARIRAMNAQATIQRATNAEVDLDQVLDVGGFDLQRALDVDPSFMEPEYPFEWGGIYELASGTYRLRLEEGPDPAMKLAILPVEDTAGATLAAAAETAAVAFSGPSRRYTSRDPLYPADRVFELDLAGGATEFHVSLPSSGSYAIFTEHHPEEFSAQLLDGEEQVDPIVERAFKPDHEHDDEVASVGIDVVGAVDGKRLNAWLSELLQTKGPDIYRMKGVLAIRDSAERIVFQGVHMLFDSAPDRAWLPDEERRSKMIFIGRDLDRESIEAGFRACLA